MSTEKRRLYRVTKDGHTYVTLTATSPREAVTKARAATTVPKGAVASLVYPAHRDRPMHHDVLHVASALAPGIVRGRVAR